MADYKQVPAFCYHCNKQVVAKKEEIDHKFWLIASCLSCGLFAFVWIIKMLTHNPPALCSQCGLAIGKNPQMQNAGIPRQAQPGRANFVPQNSDEAAGKGLSPVAKSAIVAVVGLFAMLILCRVMGDVSSIANPKQAATTSQPSQNSVTPDQLSKSTNGAKNAKERERWAVGYQTRMGKDYSNLKIRVSGKDNTTLIWKSEAAIHESAVRILDDSGYYKEVYEQGFKKLVLTDTSGHEVIITRE